MIVLVLCTKTCLVRGCPTRVGLIKVKMLTFFTSVVADCSSMCRSLILYKTLAVCPMSSTATHTIQLQIPLRLSTSLWS
jgi:hypothetical protein